MSTAIIYHSVFHTTEQYAKWLAEAIGAELAPMRKAKDKEPGGEEWESMRMRCGQG